MPLHVINEETTDPQVPIYKRIVTITHAQILTLPATPVELVPAPGAGKLIIFHKAVTHREALAASYTGIVDGDGIRFTFETGGDPVGYGFWRDDASSETELTTLLSTADGQPKTWLTKEFAGATLRAGEIQSFENKALVLFGLFTNSSLGGGDAANTFGVTVFYSIVDL
jgi:hypothetical protein